MFSILFSIFFLKCILAIPLPSSSPPIYETWSKLKEQKTLQRFNSTLLNDKLLPFLNDCYTDQDSKSKHLITCSLYFDAILQLNSTNYIVQQPTVVKLAQEGYTKKNFCSQKHTFPAIKYYQNVTQPVDFSNPEICSYFCIELENLKFVPKPICTFLVWLGDQIKKEVEPIAPLNVVSAKPEIPIVKTTKSTEKQPDVIEEKPAVLPTPSNIPNATNTHNNVPVEEVAKNDSQVRAPVVKAKPAVPKLPVASEAGPIPAVEQKPENKPLEPISKSKEKAPPVNNVNGQEEVPPTNVEKQESLSNDQPGNEEQANDTESDGDMNEDQNLEDNEDIFGMENTKIKTKEVPIAVPDENESNRKTSQETIDSNYFSPSVNHGTDPFLEESGSNFFTYFLMGMFLCIVLYVIYHNKTKILALLLEGRRGDKGRNGRRKHTAAYRKLDSNLEEAITSSASGRTTQIIY